MHQYPGKHTVEKRMHPLKQYGSLSNVLFRNIWSYQPHGCYFVVYDLQPFMICFLQWQCHLSVEQSCYTVHKLYVNDFRNMKKFHCVALTSKFTRFQCHWVLTEHVRMPLLCRTYTLPHNTHQLKDLPLTLWHKISEEILRDLAAWLGKKYIVLQTQKNKTFLISWHNVLVY